MAADVAAGNRGRWDPYTHELYRATFAFLGPIALIFEIFGPVVVVGQLYVALLGALTAAATSRLALELMPARWALLAGLIVGFLPSQILWSSLILKDAAVWVSLATLALVAAVAARSIGWRLLPLAAAAAGCLIALGHLRAHTMVVASWAVAMGSVFGIGKWRLPRSAACVALAVGVPWLVGFGPAGWTLVTDSGSLERRRLHNAIGAASAFVETQPDPSDSSATPDETQETIVALKTRAEDLRERAIAAADTPRTGSPRPPSQKREELLLAKAAALDAQAKELEQRVADDPPAAQETGEPEGTLEPSLAHLPLGLRVMLFEPVPWEPAGSTTHRLARWEAVVWYPVLAFALIGLLAARKHARALTFPLLVGGGTLLVYALAEGNIGTAFRHRGEFVWVVALLAALGAATARRWWLRQRVTSAAGTDAYRESMR